MATSSLQETTRLMRRMGEEKKNGQKMGTLKNRIFSQKRENGHGQNEKNHMGARLAINKKLNKIPIGKKWASWKKIQTRFKAVQGTKKICSNFSPKRTKKDTK